MKTVKMLIDWRDSFKKGQVVNFDNKGADEFVRMGYAEFVGDPKKPLKSGDKFISKKRKIKNSISKSNVSNIDTKVNTTHKSPTHGSKSNSNNKRVCVWQGGVVYKALPPTLKHQIKLRLDKEHQKHFYIFLKGDVDRVDWDFICKTSSDYSRKNNRLIFVGVLNTHSRLKVIGQDERCSVDMMLLSSSKDNLYFIDQPPRNDIKIQDYLLFNTYIYTCLLGNMVHTCYSSQVLKIGQEYEFWGIKYPNFTARKSSRHLNAMCEHNFLISEVKEIRENFSELEPVIKKIKSVQDLSLIWDYVKGTPVYSDEEISLLVMNTFFMNHGLSAFDMIVCGREGCKKSTWVEMLARIFDEEVIDGTGTTYKGLVPSFYSDKNNRGSLIESNFICIIDEFFRMFSQQSDLGRIPIRKAILKGLEEIMTILERKERTFSSGKGEEYKVRARMEASFIATDNATYESDMSNLYWSEDFNTKAIFRRFNFLVLSKESQQRGFSVANKQEDFVVHQFKQRFKKIFGTGKVYRTYRILMKLLRVVSKHIKYDDEKIAEIRKRIWTMPHQGESVCTALICSVVTLNRLLECQTKMKMNYTAQERDYVQFETLLNRINEDYVKIVGANPKSDDQDDKGSFNKYENKPKEIDMSNI